MNKKKSAFIISGLISLIVISLIIFFLLNKSEKKIVICLPIDFSISRSNSVHGLKDGLLMAYVDLAQAAPSLPCHSDAKIQEYLQKQLTLTLQKWWLENRLQSTMQAEIHIITILNKDEYARSNFNSALRHGKMIFKREEGQIKPIETKLFFDNLRTNLGKNP
jgi:hypothetical protein